MIPLFFCGVLLVFMNSVNLKVFAKLNLSLNITGILADGFHSVDTVMQSVSISDMLTVKKREDKRCFTYFESGLEIKNDSALRAAEMFVKEFGTAGADISVVKGIPFSGGMGGSSADAAGALAGLGVLYGVSVDKIAPLAERLGSDTKFMLTGGLARATGKGEILEFFEQEKFLNFVVIKCAQGLNTADIYKRFDLEPDYGAADNGKLIKALKAGDVENVKCNLSNALQKPALGFSSKVKETCDIASQAAKVFLTGSGSCFFAVCGSAEESGELCGKFRKFGLEAEVCASVKKGIEFF